MNIRPARTAEADELSSIARRAKAHWGYSAAQLEIWRSELTVTAESVRLCPTSVAEVSGEIVGFYQINTSKRPWTLEHLWVRPEAVGHGLGTALLRDAAARVSVAGGKALAIDADPNAEAFYLAMGARRIGEIAAPVEGHPDRVRPQMLLDIDKPA